MKIGRIFRFEAAHHLPHHEGKCKELHGHSYKLEVEVEGGIQKTETPEKGMVTDLSNLKKAVQEMIIDQLDHSCINTKIENPTGENILMWITERLYGDLPKVINISCITRLRLWETENSYMEVNFK